MAERGFWGRFMDRHAPSKDEVLASRWLNTRLDSAHSRFLAETDPDKGFHWLKDRRDSGNAIAHFLGEVASRDLPKVTRLWHLLEAGKPADGMERALAEAKNGFAAGRILHALSAKDWKTALTWADKNLTGSMREKNISDIFDHIGQKGTDEVLATAGEISDPAVGSNPFFDATVDSAAREGSSARSIAMYRRAF